MKKLILIISVVLGLAFISSPSYAKKLELGGTYPSTASRLIAASSDTFYVYCYYQRYYINNGYVFENYKRSYSKTGFTGCPPY